MSHVQSVQKLYDEWAPLYDLSTKRSIAYLVEDSIFADVVDPKRGDRILDLGSGTGRTVSQFVGSGAHIMGMDLSQKMLEIARQKFPNITFHEGNIEEGLPGEEGSFSKITSSLTFQFVQYAEKVFAEAHRVLTSSGTFYFTDFIADAPLEWPSVVYREPKLFAGSIGSISRFRRLVEYLEMIDHSGFRLVELRPLRVGEECRDLLTPDSFENVVGKWASLLFVLKKKEK